MLNLIYERLVYIAKSRSALSIKASASGIEGLLPKLKFLEFLGETRATHCCCTEKFKLPLGKSHKSRLGNRPSKPDPISDFDRVHR